MNTEDLKKFLLDRDTEWSAAARAGKDIDEILSYWTDDAVVMPPATETIKGKEKLREYVEGSLQIPGFCIQWNSDRAEISADHKMAYIFSTNRVSMDGPDGIELVFEGRAVTIWRLDHDGEWRCSLDMWNSEHSQN